jgi:hypothetical protein
MGSAKPRKGESRTLCIFSDSAKKPSLKIEKDMGG